MVHELDGALVGAGQPVPAPGRPAGRWPARRRLAHLPVARLPVRHDDRGAAARLPRRAPTPYAVRFVEGDDSGLEVEIPTQESVPSLMDQVVDVLCEWGLEAVFGMVGHSNLGMADALRKAEADGRLTYVGIRHEGAAAFAAAGYAKLTGTPAACLSIAGPGATNLLTGLWDAKVDRVPVLALTGQVQTQVIGPGTFQELPLEKAFAAVAEWGQTILSPDNATELAALGDEARHRPARRRPPGAARRRPGAGWSRGPAAASPSGPDGGNRHRPTGRRAGPGRRVAPGRRATGDRHRQRSPPTSGRRDGPGRAPRRPGDLDLQGEGHVPGRSPAGLRRLGPFRHPRRQSDGRAGRLPARARGVLLEPHLDPHVGADDPGRPRPDDPRQVPPCGGAAVGATSPAPSGS